MIILSAGHYPSKPGACNDNGTCEHELATEWVAYIKDLIETYIDVEVTPTGSLTNKVAFINSFKECKIAVEIHFNSNVNAKGSETLYHPTSKNGKQLAEMIQDEFEGANIYQPNRGIKEGWYRMDRPNIVDYAGDVEGDETIDYFLRKTRPIAVIVEPDFISQLDRINDDTELGCRAIADAIIKFYHRNFIHE